MNINTKAKLGWAVILGLVIYLCLHYFYANYYFCDRLEIIYCFKTDWPFNTHDNKYYIIADIAFWIAIALIFITLIKSLKNKICSKQKNKKGI